MNVIVGLCFNLTWWLELRQNPHPNSQLHDLNSPYFESDSYCSLILQSLISSMSFSLTGQVRVAYTAQLPFPAAADSGRGLHILTDALWWTRPLSGHAGPDQCHWEEWDPLVLPEEPESSEGRRPPAATGMKRWGGRRTMFFFSLFFWPKSTTFKCLLK